GSLSMLAIILGASPSAVLSIYTVILYRGKYQKYCPSFSSINIALIKDIVGLGGKFFLIQVSWLFIYQSINIIVARILGPESVTVYNIQYKYFSVIQMATAIFLSPMWSAFTEAYVKKDYTWMNKAYHKLNKIWMLTASFILVLLLVSPVLIDLWVGDSVDISFTHSAFMCLYIILLSRATLYI